MASIQPASIQPASIQPALIEPASIEIDAWNKKHVETMFERVTTWFQLGFVWQTGISMLGGCGWHRLNRHR